MDFTREPIVETVMTPREGYRLVVRSSKNLGQEEHFVDALEIIAFGSQCFFRNIERPKSFLLPVSDYEVLEVREPKIVLKTPSIEGTVKISGGRTDVKSAPAPREAREVREVREKEVKERDERPLPSKEIEVPETLASQETRSSPSALAEANRTDRRRDRRRSTRSKSSKGGSPTEKDSMMDDQNSPSEMEAPRGQEAALIEKKEEVRAKTDSKNDVKSDVKSDVIAPPIPSLILAPPTTLIRDDIARLKANELYKGAFYEVAEMEEEVQDEPISPFIATPEENEEEVFEDYRARPEPAAEALAPSPEQQS